MFSDLELFSSIISEEETQPNFPAVGPPPYLGVVGQEFCLGTHTEEEGSTFTSKCLPGERPKSCNQASWNQLSVMFAGSVCNGKKSKNG